MKSYAKPIRSPQKTKVALVKSFPPSPSESTEKLANKWLVRNAGKVKIHGIIRKQTNNHNDPPCLEIIYYR